MEKNLKVRQAQAKVCWRKGRSLGKEPPGLECGRNGTGAGGFSKGLNFTLREAQRALSWEWTSAEPWPISF